jgi:hypothetical protein
MRLEFQLTNEDFEEANYNHSRYRAWAVSWAFGLLGVSSLVSATLWPVPSVPPDAPVPRVEATGYLTLLPSACAFALVLWLLFRLTRSIGVKPWKRKRARSHGWWRGWPWLAFGSLLLAWAVLMPIAIRKKTAATIAAGFKVGQEVSPAQDIAIPLIPIAIATVLIAWVARRVHRRGWAAQRHMHRPWVVEASEDHLRLSEPLSTLDYRWACLPGFLETGNVFVLYVAPHLFHMIPKRSFADGAQIDAFRGLLTRAIQEPLR